MYNLNKFLVIISVVAFIAGPITVSAATAPTWGAAYGYSILGGTTVTNTGPSTASGFVGVSPNSSIVDGAGGLISAGEHKNDASAIDAQTNATAVYNSLNQDCTSGPVGPTDLKGAVLTPGVYCYSSSAQISSGGVLHL